MECKPGRFREPCSQPVGRSTARWLRSALADQEIEDRASLACSFEPTNELFQRHPDSLANPSQFKEVKASFARLVLADKGLGLAQAMSNVRLSKASLCADLSEQPVQPLTHSVLVTAGHGRTVNPPAVYPKTGYPWARAKRLWIADRDGRIPFMQRMLFEDNRLCSVPPFRRGLLKWIGSKQRVAHEIVSYFPPDYGTYFEPFLGAGAVLATLSPGRGFASDAFKPLIEIWQMLRDDAEGLKTAYADR